MLFSIPIEIFVKDLGLVLDLGEQTGSHLSLSAAAHQVFKDAADLGFGSLDDSAVVKVYEQASSCAVNYNNDH